MGICGPASPATLLKPDQMTKGESCAEGKGKSEITIKNKVQLKIQVVQGQVNRNNLTKPFHLKDQKNDRKKQTLEGLEGFLQDKIKSSGASW